MKKLLLGALLIATVPAYAETPPSAASIRELVTLTDVRKMMDTAYGQMDGMMAQAMKQALGDATATPAQEALIEEFKQKSVELVRTQLGWEKMEPAYLDLYAKTFSQSEVDGMLAFYKSEAGRAVLAKTPKLMTNMTQMMMVQMQSFMPALQKLVAEYQQKVRDAGK